MKRSLLVLALILFIAPAMAQVKDLAQIDMRLGPPNFSSIQETLCSSPNMPIPDNTPGGASDTMTVGGDATITDLTVLIQAEHTWVGDLQFALTHDDTGTSALIIDRPGEPASGFGCSNDDIDASLNDGNANSVEDECAGSVPTIAGDLSPSPDALSAFNGETAAGDWSLNVTDNAGGDTGTLIMWCLDDPAISEPGGDGGTGTPATSTWGVIALIALFMSVSLFYLRRRSGANA
jgi:hypothetical protein